jgi:short-subunit dehydrogenase
MKCAVITGASSGIGLECAKIVAKERLFGVEKLFLLARRKEQMEDLYENIGIEAQIIKCDVTDMEDMDAFADVLDKEKPDIALLVNSAGFGKNGEFEDISPVDNTGMIDVNCAALVFMTQLCLNFMKEGAHIINISSVAGFAPLAKFAVYGASKAFVTSFSVGLSVELEKKGISVTICAPGSVDTQFHKIARGGTGITKKLYSTKAPVEKVARLALEDAAKGKLFSSYGLGAKVARLFGGVVPKKAFAKFSYDNIYA